MNEYKLVDIFIQDLSHSGLYIDDKNIGTNLIKGVFSKCESQDGAAIYSDCNSLKLEYVCCYRCHASSRGSFVMSYSIAHCNDSSCVGCSPNVPVKDDNFNVENNCFLKRMNFSDNKAKGSSAFQCHKSQSFEVKYVFCTKGRESHIVEFSGTNKWSVDSLILIENSYSIAGIYFSVNSPEKVTFANCIFTKNEGSKQFISIGSWENIEFISCLYEGEASFGVESSEVEVTTSCVVPNIEVGISTYECVGVLLNERFDCTNIQCISISFVQMTLSLLNPLIP